jgi:hypothetical protein
MHELEGTTRLHGVTAQKMPTSIITAERTSHTHMYFMIMMVSFKEGILIEMDVKRQAGNCFGGRWSCDRVNTRCEQGSDRRTKSDEKAPIISGQHFLAVTHHILSSLPSA